MRHHQPNRSCSRVALTEFRGIGGLGHFCEKDRGNARGVPEMRSVRAKRHATVLHTTGAWEEYVCMGANSCTGGGSSGSIKPA